MYLHKYVSDGNTFYMIGASAKPSGSLNLTAKEWQGKATGQNVESAIKAIHRAFKEDAEKAEFPEEKKEKTARYLSVAEHVRYLAQNAKGE